MIIDAIFAGFALIVSAIWNVIPDSEGFPDSVMDSISYIGGFLASVDFFFPVDVMIDVVQFYLAMWIISLPFIAVIFSVKMWHKA